MIHDLPDTTTKDVSKALVSLRNDVGAMTLGRVLTLIVVVEDIAAAEAVDIATQASRQHPSRILVVVPGDRRGKGRLDAQIRLGGDAGASEIVVLRLFGELAGHADSVVVPLLLADSPIVAWWPGEAPADVSADPIGAMAQRRITDAAEHRDPRKMLRQRAKTYSPGDTDMSWTRVTRWRGLLAAALDQPPFEPVTEAVVAGAPDSPSADLLAAWLLVKLKAPVKRVNTPRGSGISSVRLERKSGPIDLVRPGDVVATLSQPGQPDRRIELARRHAPECLADELRRLDPDDTYEEALLRGLEHVTRGRVSAAAAARAGEAPSVEGSKRLARKLRDSTDRKSASAMVEAPEPPGSPSDEQVHTAVARKLAGRRTPREKERAAATSKGTAASGKKPARRASKRT